LRRNAGLYHLPTLVITKPGDESVANAAIERGASAVTALNESSGPGLGWLFEAIRRERKRKAAEHELRALRDIMGDPRTGLFRRATFEAHLARLAEDHHANGRPLSLAALRVLPAHGARAPSEEVWKRGFSEVASLAGRLARDADSGAAIGGDVIAMALPAANLLAARRAAERIASVAECTAFASGENSSGPLVFEQSTVELQPGESGMGLLARALRALELESIPA
jgi:two-component system cell cycle response regulator PopA